MTDNSRHVREAELVHEMRKTIKRMRALARLLRYELGEQELDAVNGYLRDAGRRLAGQRDAEVRLATLERLRASRPKALTSKGIELLRERLEREQSHASRSLDEPELLRDILYMREAIASWRELDPDLDAIERGLERIYGDGHHRYGCVRSGGTSDAELHNWRKRVKALYYALDMLGGDRKGRMRGATKQAERLGDVLGEEHDLWMLATYAKEHSEAFGDDGSSRVTLLKAIKRRQRRLRKLALDLGAGVYEPEPSDFARNARGSLR